MLIGLDLLLCSKLLQF